MSHECAVFVQEIDELLGQNLTEEDEEAIAAELESIISVSRSCNVVVMYTYMYNIGSHCRGMHNIVDT